MTSQDHQSNPLSLHEESHATVAAETKYKRPYVEDFDEDKQMVVPKKQTNYQEPSVEDFDEDEQMVVPKKHTNYQTPSVEDFDEEKQTVVPKKQYPIAAKTNYQNRSVEDFHKGKQTVLPKRNHPAAARPNNQKPGVNDVSQYKKVVDAKTEHKQKPAHDAGIHVFSLKDTNDPESSKRESPRGHAKSIASTKGHLSYKHGVDNQKSQTAREFQAPESKSRARSGSSSPDKNKFIPLSFTPSDAQARAFKFPPGGIAALRIEDLGADSEHLGSGNNCAPSQAQYTRFIRNMHTSRPTPDPGPGGVLSQKFYGLDQCLDTTWQPRTGHSHTTVQRTDGSGYVHSIFDHNDVEGKHTAWQKSTDQALEMVDTLSSSK